MIALFVATVLLLGIAAVAAMGRSQRRTAELETTLHAALTQRLDGDLVVTKEFLTRAQERYRLPRTRLLAVARRAGAEIAVAAGAEVLRHPLQPLSGALSLKIHGARVRLHLVNPAVLELTPPEPRLARRQEPALSLAATYRIDGQTDQCVSEDHLRDQGIDTMDLHGIALAVLRQRFDDDLVRRLLEGNPEDVRVESQDGSAAALLLVLADFLPPDARVVATLESPDRLVLEALSDSTDPTAGTGLRLLVDDQGWKVL